MDLGCKKLETYRIPDPATLSSIVFNRHTKPCAAGSREHATKVAPNSSDEVGDSSDSDDSRHHRHHQHRSEHSETSRRHSSSGTPEIGYLGNARLSLSGRLSPACTLNHCASAGSNSHDLGGNAKGSRRKSETGELSESGHLHHHHHHHHSRRSSEDGAKKEGAAGLSRGRNSPTPELFPITEFVPMKEPREMSPLEFQNYALYRQKLDLQHRPHHHHSTDRPRRTSESDCKEHGNPCSEPALHRNTSALSLTAVESAKGEPPRHHRRKSRLGSGCNLDLDLDQHQIAPSSATVDCAAVVTEQKAGKGQKVKV